MRKPPSDSSAPTDATDPPGGRALDRARQFALSRGLPPPLPDAVPPISQQKARAPTKPALRKLTVKSGGKK